MGSDVDTDKGVDIPGGSRQSVWSYAIMHAFQAVWPETKPGTCDDVAEICGGSARATQLSIR
eukprot:10332232-Heterocapsa_arctica.AAC.1